MVKRIADRYRVKGMVRNAEDGAVEILAEANDETLKLFENEIDIDTENGPSVVSIERHCEGGEMFPRSARDYEDFVIAK